MSYADWVETVVSGYVIPTMLLLSLVGLITFIIVMLHDWWQTR